jgi:hypothetical protein
VYGWATYLAKQGIQNNQALYDMLNTTECRDFLPIPKMDAMLFQTNVLTWGSFCKAQYGFSGTQKCNITEHMRANDQQSTRAFTALAT